MMMTSADPYAALSGLTAAAARFTVGLRFDDIDAETLRLARRCVLDGLGVALAGSEQHGMAPLRRFIERQGGVAEARLLGSPRGALPAHLAALWFGTAGHAMDWDDTQLAEGPGRPYGLLMHPTMPPLAASLAAAELVLVETGVPVDGKRMLTAFCAGFEVGCKIAEAITPDHYMRGFHTSGTIGTFAATAAAANMLGLDEKTTAQALGIAASSASGVRANFGTMTKPLHVGRAAQNGINAALLAREGFSANEEALDGRWGYLAIAGPGGEPALVRDRFGAPHTMASPGVSIKPYPSGVLTHPSMDAMRALMAKNGLAPVDIAHVTLLAGSNVLGPIRFQRAMTELEGKFSFQFLLSAIILRGKAGKAEFTDAFVASDECQDMQGRIETRFDQGIEDMGWDKIRSRIEVRTTDGREIVEWADERYRGGPDYPLTDAELEEKARDCAAGLLDEDRLDRLFGHVWALETLPDVGVLFDDLCWMDA
ncbi:MmgE/PrpD family protein [Sphingomonas crocodyli]|uniref:MmgE/PrpD family protein n=1 Tax=Sphingomonas crocodyli TaxID=1979270 RepID=A0A437M047_9SPHN|nr:MmgE/PrpD family protein [Sphingomonas crocodyli]RVT90973.1 MmgE/PrpD family protein [Sphingomonas crocodyli]